jgi:hypothetical protein
MKSMSFVVIMVLVSIFVNACSRGGESTSNNQSQQNSGMSKMMDSMMKDADHRRAMVEMLRRNPAMREQMKVIISDAEKPAASPTAK